VLVRLPFFCGATYSDLLSHCIARKNPIGSGLIYLALIQPVEDWLTLRVRWRRFVRSASSSFRSFDARLFLLPLTPGPSGSASAS
jgi:hypothetical protein